MVRSKGEAAVEVVQNYRDVSSLINESLTLALQANRTAQATLARVR